MSNRLQTIANRQRKSFIRDLAFTALVALAAFVSVTSVGTAAQAASMAGQQLQIAHR